LEKASDTCDDPSQTATSIGPRRSFSPYHGWPRGHHGAQ
jgi:hypothetical protein